MELNLELYSNDLEEIIKKMFFLLQENYYETSPDIINKFSQVEPTIRQEFDKTISVKYDLSMELLIDKIKFSFVSGSKKEQQIQRIKNNTIQTFIKRVHIDAQDTYEGSYEFNTEWINKEYYIQDTLKDILKEENLFLTDDYDGTFTISWKNVDDSLTDTIGFILKQRDDNATEKKQVIIENKFTEFIMNCVSEDILSTLNKTTKILVPKELRFNKNKLNNVIDKMLIDGIKIDLISWENEDILDEVIINLIETCEIYNKICEETVKSFIQQITKKMTKINKIKIKLTEKENNIIDSIISELVKCRLKFKDNNNGMLIISKN